jgi:hypothetical protein
MGVGSHREGVEMGSRRQRHGIETASRRHRDGVDMASTWVRVISNPVITVDSILPLFTQQYAESRFLPCYVPCSLTLLPILSNCEICLFFRGQSGFSPRFSGATFSCCGVTFLLRTQVAASAPNEHPYSQSFCFRWGDPSTNAAQCTRRYDFWQERIFDFKQMMHVPVYAYRIPMIVLQFVIPCRNIYRMQFLPFRWNKI